MFKKLKLVAYTLTKTDSQHLERMNSLVSKNSFLRQKALKSWGTSTIYLMSQRFSITPSKRIEVVIVVAKN